MKLRDRWSSMEQKTLVTRAVFLVVVLCIGLGLWGSKRNVPDVTSISFEELYNDGDISIMGVDRNTNKAEFEEMIGMSYAEYLTMMDDATINNQLEPYMFLLEGMPAVCWVRFEDQRVGNLIFDFMNEDALSPEAWVRATDSLIQKLENVSSDTVYWRYTLPDADVRLELSSVNMEGYGFRASEMWITFTSDQ